MQSQMSVFAKLATVAVSEFLVSDSETIGQRLISTKPVAPGRFAEWTGDITTGTIKTTDFNKVSTFKPATINRATVGNRKIVGVEFVVNATRDKNSPDTGARMKAVVADATHVVEANQLNVLPSGIETKRRVVWKTNPITKKEWTMNDFNNIEFGIKS